MFGLKFIYIKIKAQCVVHTCHLSTCKVDRCMRIECGDYSVCHYWRWGLSYPGKDCPHSVNSETMNLPSFCFSLLRSWSDSPEPLDSVPSFLLAWLW